MGGATDATSTSEEPENGEGKSADDGEGE